MDHVPGDFFHRMMALDSVETFSSTGSRRVILSIATMVYCLKYARKSGAILVTFGASAAVLFLHLPVETHRHALRGNPSGLRNSLFRIFTTTSFGSFCQQRSPWRCLAPFESLNARGRFRPYEQ